MNHKSRGLVGPYVAGFGGWGKQTMRVCWQPVFVLLALLFLPGCLAPGRQLKHAAVEKLQKGQTEAQVRSVFGDPKRTELGADGRRLDVYQVQFLRRMPEPHRALVYRTLCVLYDQTKRVEDFSYHVGELQVWQTAMGWEAGQKLDENLVRGLQRETNSRNDVIAAFGPPTIEGLDQDGGVMLAWHFLEGQGAFFTAGQELLVKLDDKNRIKDYRWRALKP